jgi:hypothetical protein
VVVTEEDVAANVGDVARDCPLNLLWCDQSLIEGYRGDKGGQEGEEGERLKIEELHLELYDNEFEADS